MWCLRRLLWQVITHAGRCVYEPLEEKPQSLCPAWISALAWWVPPGCPVSHWIRWELADDVGM
jgi:hypothetical protein